MSDVRTDDLKGSTFDTWSVLDARRGSTVKTVQVPVNNKAATRQAIILALRRAGRTVETRSEWKAKPGASSDGPDWDYKAIAIHHAGNSYSCAAGGADQLRKAEQTDISKFGHISYHYAIACDGTIYEALDIREKGAHIANGNTGVVGIVLLADLTVPGEAAESGPGAWNVLKDRGVRAGVNEWLAEQKDKLSSSNDELHKEQLDSASVLVKTLLQFFNIKTLGGHREFAKGHGTSRACPGIFGMILVDKLRIEFTLGPP